MTDNSSKVAIAVGVVGSGCVLGAFAYLRPGYFNGETYLGGLLLIEVLAAAVVLYRRVFFPFVIVSFLLAGVDLPISGVWTVARWPVLGVGAVVGALMVLKRRSHRFGLFHVLALLAVLAALASAAVSRYMSISILKVLSLFLLFLYSATGARIAVTGRESRFFSGLLVGCEVLVALIAATYLAGMEVMGNPNSLGAVMGVAMVPILLWGTMLPQGTLAHRRRVFLLLVALYLTFASHARAALLAAFVVSAILCVALRRYSLLAQGIGIIAILAASSAIIQPEEFSKTIDSLTSSIIYKGKDPTQGVLSSRESPWQETIDTIRDHFWFGTGFGTSDTGQDASEGLGKFSTSSASSKEHGSSYLAISAWVGMLGVIPFLLLLGALVGKIIQTMLWMKRTGDPNHPAIPIAMVVLAGLVHASFEDWMFAPGYYLSVFFWSFAFILVDQAKSLTISDMLEMFSWRVRAARQSWQALAPTR